MARSVKQGLRQGESRGAGRFYDGLEAAAATEPPIGAHLVTPRRGFSHHGIYAGEGRVVHYAGLSRRRRRGPVEEVTLAGFAQGHGVYVKPCERPCFARQEVVRRAYSRLGEDQYRIFTNNCEHFCQWCLRGESRSEQIERWWPRSVMCSALSWARSRFVGWTRPALTGHTVAA